CRTPSGVLHDDLEAAVIERPARRGLDLHDALSLAGALHLERPVMAVRVVARLAEEHEGRPGTARAALVRVVPAAAVAPEVLDRAIARVPHRLAAPLPDVDQLGVADVPAGPLEGRQRGAALDATVGLDAERRVARAARVHVALGHRPPEHVLVGTE